MFPKIEFTLKGGYKKGKIEKDFQKEIMTKLRNIGCIAYHIADVGLAAKFLDCFFIDNYGNTFFIEFKKIKGDTFNVSQFEDNQVILLKELDKRNSELCRVFIYSEKNNDYKVYKFSELWEQQNKVGGIKIFNNK